MWRDRKQSAVSQQRSARSNSLFWKNAMRRVSQIRSHLHVHFFSNCKRSSGITSRVHVDSFSPNLTPVASIFDGSFIIKISILVKTIKHRIWPHTSCHLGVWEIQTIEPYLTFKNRIWNCLTCSHQHVHVGVVLTVNELLTRSLYLWPIERRLIIDSN